MQTENLGILIFSFFLKTISLSLKEDTALISLAYLINSLSNEGVFILNIITSTQDLFLFI